MPKPRAPKKATEYSSPVRDEAKQATRERIIDALVRVVLDDGVHAFSVASVAARAGVSHRTVYRHFASREELLEGLSDAVDMPPDPAKPPPTPLAPDLDRMTEQLAMVFQRLDDVRDRATAEFIIGVALRHTTRGKRARWERIQDAVRERYPALTREEQLAGAAALRALLSSNAWFHLCVQLDVPVEPATQGLVRAIELVLEDLARRNAAKDPSKTKRGGK